MSAQTLVNVSFGVGAGSPKAGLAAAGLGTNDFWNHYHHYEPKFAPGMPLVSSGRLDKLKLADGSPSEVSVAVTNAPGVWGNSSGDPMYDAYVFAQNGSNLTVTVGGLAPGRYHFYLYGHADPDVTGEQNSVFSLAAGTNTLGPLAQMGGSLWKAGLAWQERAQYVVFRDVEVKGEPVVILVAPGPNGVAVINGLQILSRGTGPPLRLSAPPPEPTPTGTNLLFRELRYAGQVSNAEARFTVEFEVESLTTNEISAPLFDGDVALVTPELPNGLRIVSRGRQTRLFCTALGNHPVKLELLAKITRAEPWNQVSFTGPPAAIASITVASTTEGVQVQLLSGVQVSEAGHSTGPVPAAGDASGPLRGFLGADRLVALRWQGRAAEVARKSLVNVDVAASAQITPAVIKYTTELRYEILQAAMPRLTIELPATHALTRIQGEQIRDWQVKAEGGRQILDVEFIKPVEKSWAVTLLSEQALEATPLVASLVPPHSLGVERESGSFTLSADDTTVAIDSANGLRQVNAPAGAMAAYRFYGWPVAVSARIERVEPVLTVADRVTTRLEETRLLVAHQLNLVVEKAGVYALEFTPQPGLTPTEVTGEGINDWKVTGGKLKVSFASRVLGARSLGVQLEEANREFPQTITVKALPITGATNVTTQLGAASAPGIRLKTARLASLVEIPVGSLPNRTDESLAFASEQPDWTLTLTPEKLPARVVAEVFNLVTIGDGLVGGSATIRYGIFNQGVQEFRVAVPAHWKNVEFIGANIRRKEQQTNVWTLALQDKAWGGYTLVVTYDYPFEPKGGALDLAGAHALGVERETGSLGVMTAASLELTPAAPAEPLRRVDESELSDSDRALCTRPLLLAYKYTGGTYRHTAQVERFEEARVLAAVADRIELTTVLTEQGQLLTQSSFMVKNNEKQFQRFRLPQGADFWSSYVNGQPAKPERDGDWYLVPLPRELNRDQAAAVDIVYAQTTNFSARLFPRRVGLAAPLTDIPSTYAEWQLFIPVSQRLSRFAGNMTVARGTTYDLRDAWQEFVQFYGNLVEQNFPAMLFCFGIGVLLVLLETARRRGIKGAVTVIVVFTLLAILAAMLLPALSSAKGRAQRINAVNNLKQIGLAAKTWSLDNSDAFPPSFEAMSNELSTDKITFDPSTGQRFVYVGAGKSESNPEAILAYSPSDANGRAVVFADGSVSVLTPEKFQEALQRDAAVPRVPVAPNAAPVPAPAPPLAAAVPPAQEVAQQAQALTQALPLNAPAAPAVRRYAARNTGVAERPPGQINPATGLPLGANLAGSGGIGGGGGFGGIAPALPQAQAMVAGVRPIRIDVPRTGQAFSFTKVLNTGQEPLTISFAMMPLKVYRAVQMVLQACGFLFGLILLWALAIRRDRSSFWMTVATALILWSVARLLTMWRLLHVGLIAAVPLLLLLLIAWGIARLWRRRRVGPESHEGHAPASPRTGSPGASTASAAGLIGLLAILAAAPSARGEEGNLWSNRVSILSATYTGSVRDQIAEFDATLRVSTAATNQTIPLFNDDVALESFAARGDAKLVREGRALAVWVPACTNVDLHFKLVAKLGGEVSRRQLAFGIPPALSSRVSVVIDEAEADVEFPSAVTFERTRT